MNARKATVLGACYVCLHLSWISSAAGQAFEVASVRLDNDESRPVFAVGPELRNGTFKASRVTLRKLIAAAYDVSEPLVDGPSWLGEIRCNIVAKSPQAVPDSAMKRMLQALLKERFRLAVHESRRETSVYYLELAPGGVKMDLYKPREGSAAAAATPYRGFPTIRGSITMPQLATALASMVELPVIDRTGLAERYNVVLSFARPADLGAATPEFGPPDIFKAMQEQLGLKLRPGKTSVNLIVADHVERTPIEN